MCNKAESDINKLNSMDKVEEKLEHWAILQWKYSCHSIERWATLNDDIQNKEVQEISLKYMKELNNYSFSSWSPPKKKTIKFSFQPEPNDVYINFR